jgi:hypothetical protein
VANPSNQFHVEQAVGIVVPVAGVETALAVKIVVPVCLVDHVSALPFWATIKKLSDITYLNVYDDDRVRAECKELLTQLSSWAVAFLPVIDDGELKNSLELLAFLGSHVQLISGGNGLLVGRGDNDWLIAFAGGLESVESTKILRRTD